jgi:hypothetical protein
MALVMSKSPFIFLPTLNIRFSLKQHRREAIMRFRIPRIQRQRPSKIRFCLVKITLFLVENSEVSKDIG